MKAPVLTKCAAVSCYALLCASAQAVTNFTDVELGTPTVNGSLKLHQGNFDTDGMIRIQSNVPNGTTVAALTKFSSANPSGSLGLHDISSTNLGIEMRGRFAAGGSHGGWMALKSGGVEGVAIAARNSSTGTGGLVNVNRNDGANTLRLIGQDAAGGGRLEVANGANSTTIEMRGALSATNPAAFVTFKDNGGERISFAARNAATNKGGLINVKNNSGVDTVKLIGDTGSGFGKIETSVLQITGGSDLSESFDVCDSQVEGSPWRIAPQAGMVVSIATSGAGNLVVSAQPYDRAVAGIVSGAGGVRTGMVMGQAGSVADGKHPVALTGRVYCQCDAGYGAIRPGDRLTTSATPGHAMKVSDYDLASGAVIGKAMTALESGQGLVLVLVQPQ